LTDISSRRSGSLDHLATLNHERKTLQGDWIMLTIKHVLFAVALVGFATGAEAQTNTTYIGGPKSGLTQSINVGGANAIGADNAHSSYARATPVRQRSVLPRAARSGGVQAIGSDN
jgi:hypothetical protein